MGQSASRNQLQQQYDVIKVKDDGSTLLRHRKDREQFLLRTVCSNIGEQINGFEELLRKRQAVRSPHLLELKQVRRKQQKNVCSVVHKMYLLIEYPFKTLKDQFSEKVANNRQVPFVEAELWSILYSCSMALSVLYQRKMPHQSLTLSDIYVSREGLIKISDPLLLGLERNYIKILKNQEERTHISPEIMNFLDDCNFSFYDKEKSDVFILGAIIMEIALLKEIDLFQKKSKRPILEHVDSSIKEIRQKYSENFAQKIEKMVNLHSKLRPTFAEIIHSIEEDNSLFEDSTTTDGQFAKSNQNSKTLVRNNSKSTSFYKTSSQLSENGDSTIIKKLQNQPKPISFNQNVSHPVFNPPNIQQTHHSHSKLNLVLGSNNKGINYNSSAPLKNFSSVPVQKQQQTYVNLQNEPDRFSYTKFGNITLNNHDTRPKSKPLFSHQIPQINQIIRNTQKNTSVQKTRQNYTQNYQFTTSYSSNSYKNYSTQYSSPSVPTQNLNLNLNKFTSEPPFVQSAYNTKTNFNSSFNTKVQYNPKPPSYPSSPHTNNSGGESTIPSAHIKLPDLNLSSNDQSKKLEKDGSGEKVMNRTASGKISLNSTLKGKNNNIYPVSEKTQEHLQSSPQPNYLKLNEPQKSPGPSPSSHHQSNQQYPPSSTSSAKKTQNQQESHFVTEFIDGGSKYQGFVKNGAKNGEGRLQFNDGGFYTGEWKDNKMHGYGKLHYQNGQVAYQGNWENDQFCGMGRVFNDKPERMDEGVNGFDYRDFGELGEKWIYYQGNFKNDSKHGFGKIRLTNGEVFQGNFVFDSIEGQGNFYASNGQVIKGIWQDNKLVKLIS